MSAFTARNIKKLMGIPEHARAGDIVAEGTFTANGTTSVVVNTTRITADSVVAITLKTVGGTPAGAPYLFAVTPGTSFTVRSVSGDTSVYNYKVIN
jgi:hypothetical protein